MGATSGMRLFMFGKGEPLGHERSNMRHFFPKNFRVIDNPDGVDAESGKWGSGKGGDHKLVIDKTKGNGTLDAGIKVV